MAVRRCAVLGLRCVALILRSAAAFENQNNRAPFDDIEDSFNDNVSTEKNVY